MSESIIKQLRPPPEGKTGWPWTEEVPPLPPRMPDGAAWPRITVVTPSFNQAEFIEETIRSVLLQGYPNLEYIVIDAGSTDGSVEIIRGYQPWLAHWASGPDEGQADAVNKGWRRGTGEVLAWINSDDFYYPGAFAAVAKHLAANTAVAFVYGQCDLVDRAGRFKSRYPACPYDYEELVLHWDSRIPQPAAFARREPVFEAGLLHTSLKGAMDYDLWLRLGERHRGMLIPERLAAWRHYDEVKSIRLIDTVYLEVMQAQKRVEENRSLAGRFRRAARQGRQRTLSLLMWEYVRRVRIAGVLRTARLAAAQGPHTLPALLCRTAGHAFHAVRRRIGSSGI